MRSALLWVALPVFIAVGGGIAIYQAAQLPVVSEQSTHPPEVGQAADTERAPQIQQPHEARQSVIVFIAPYSGKCYHATESCRGLSNARSIEAISLGEAERRGLTPCKICH